MKRKNIQNTNGINISDSIVMSVKQKHPSRRKIYAAAITIIGMLSVLMSFLGMFHFRYDKSAVAAAFFCFAVFHILIALKGGKALGAYLLSVLGFLLLAWRKSEVLVKGFKYVYNVIYKESIDPNAVHFKDLKKALEIPSVTTLFVFYIWLLAIVICYFTICRPNPVLPLMVTFPLLEIGLYNGVKMPVFWGVMCISYWLAILAMSTIDVGEYSGGQSGFVRKNNLFFPKRHMKLKVTERCGMFVIASVMIVAVLANGYLNITHYKRSDSINQKRRDITEAAEDFSFHNLGESIANLTNAFGFNFDYENHKLGTSDHVRYKNITDLTITIEKPVSGPLYLKEDIRALYHDNEWFEMPSSKYNDKMFNDFEEYGISPQNFPAIFGTYIKRKEDKNTIWIKNSPRKKRRVYSPYGIENFGKIKYENDTLVFPETEKKGETSYKFVPISPDDIEALLDKDTKVFLDDSQNGSLVFDPTPNSAFTSNRTVFSASEITDQKWSDKVLKYCKDNDLINYDDYFTIDYELSADTSYLYEHGNIIMAELLQNSYKNFVYENYLDVPQNKDMEEVREAYSDLVNIEHGSTAEEVFEILNNIRIRMASNSTYTLEPGATPSSRDFVNYFLMKSHKGYCTHYATSGVILARMAGIPARYATGYILVENDLKAGKKNSDDSVTINVKDNRSHAWAEVYIDGIGWIPYEFTAGYTQMDIPPETTQADETTTSAPPDQTTTTDTSVSNTTKNTALTSAHTTTSAIGTSVTATTIVKGGKNGKGIHIPSFIKNIFITILFIGALVIMMRGRRALILKIREKHIKTGDARKRIRYMYSYAEKLLAEINLRGEYGNYKQFAENVEKWHGGIYFENGGFEKITDIALRTAFNNETPSEEDLKKCEKVLNDLAKTIFKKSDRLGKFSLMYLKVLVKGE
ncbi:transglutaminase-like domain-containing protein [Ruminococcus sp.]|uniref:transglutaminase-like domain-containing protein n=1 Tax=Ruminococcus sp. TaxID=41978 RepID=UPI0025CEFF69|nr:transglutaminase-like domain-containing protein [Ruminococcus sp.]MCR4637808.1 transglutaminase-like domain-containing protein [Ruminococcus sp.]